MLLTGRTWYLHVHAVRFLCWTVERLCERVEDSQIFCDLHSPLDCGGVCCSALHSSPVGRHGTESWGRWPQRWVGICSPPPHSGPCQTLCAQFWVLDEGPVRSKAEESWRWWSVRHAAWMNQWALVSEGCPVEDTLSEHLGHYNFYSYPYLKPWFNFISCQRRFNFLPMYQIINTKIPKPNFPH